MIQAYLNSGLAYGLMRYLRIPHNVADPGASIGASNFFETVVGVLVEVPVMLSICAVCNMWRHLFSCASAAMSER